MFIPLASETSIGAMVPKNKDGIHEDTREIREVALYTSGFRRRIYNSAEQNKRMYANRGNEKLTHPLDLSASKTFVGPAAGNVRQRLSAADSLFQFTTFTRSRGVLPDRCIGHGESYGSQLIQK